MMAYKFALIFLAFNIAVGLKIQPAIVSKDGNTCPAAAEQARRNMTEQVNSILGRLTLVPECGPGSWAQVVNLNLTLSEQNCPSPWVTQTSPVRSCAVASPGCASVYYDPLTVTYQKVCGMALGYATHSPDGLRNSGIDTNYLDGVSITHGEPGMRTHIWSLAAGHDDSVYGFHRCPCDNPNRNEAALPGFVGQNYFCDNDHVDGPVWDGEGCKNSCCSFNSPPWFSTTLPAPTSDSIEARICQDQDAIDERIYLVSLSLFVQ